MSSLEKTDEPEVKGVKRRVSNEITRLIQKDEGKQVKLNDMITEGIKQLVTKESKVKEQE